MSRVLARASSVDEALDALLPALGGLAFPVRNAAEVVAVVEFFTRRAEPSDDGLLLLTEALGHQIGQFLQRRNAEALLEENEQRYAAIVNGALDAIVAIDNDGFVTEFNAAAERPLRVHEGRGIW